METINSGQASTLILYLSPTKSFFLFEFLSGVNCTPVIILPENVSTCTDYQKFVINHTFDFGGVWTLNIYEQDTFNNTETANATLLDTIEVKIIVPESCENAFPAIITNPCPTIDPVDFTCAELLAPSSGLSDTQKICIIGDLNCATLIANLSDAQKSCILRSLDCAFLNSATLGLTAEQKACSTPEYNAAAANYFARVVINGDSSMTLDQKLTINAKFIALENEGITNSTVDRLFADKCCYTEIQALTAWLWNSLGTDMATPVGSPTFTPGTGWVHNGLSYIDTNYIANVDSSKFTLGNGGWYHSIESTDNGIIENCCGGCRDTLVPPYEIRALDRVVGLLFWSINSDGYTNFADVATYQNYQLKYNGVTFSLKAGATTHTDALTVSDHLPSLSMFRGAFNNDGIVRHQMKAGTKDRWLCIADSSFDKDIIQAALDS